MRWFSVVAVLAAACGGAASSPTVPGSLEMKGESMLTIDGKPISKEFVDALTGQIPARQLEMMKESGQFKDFVEQMALGQVLYERAVAEKMYEDPAVRFKIAIAERDAIIKEYMNRASLKATTPEALQKAYDDKASMYKRPQVKVRHVLVKEQAEADAVLALLKGGGDFAAIATEKSADRGSAGKGGDLGWISNGQISKEFSEAAFAATPNEILGPISDRMGYHILQVTEKRDAIPLDDVKDQLETMVKQEALKGLFDEVKGAAKIEWKVEVAGKPAAPPSGAPSIQLAPASGGAPPAGARPAPPAGAPPAPPAGAPPAPPAGAPPAPPPAH